MPLTADGLGLVAQHKRAEGFVLTIKVPVLLMGEKKGR